MVFLRKKIALTILLQRKNVKNTKKYVLNFLVL